MRILINGVFASLALAGCSGGGSTGGGTGEPPVTYTRPDNVECLAFERPTPSSGYTLTDAFPDVGRLRAMTKILQAPNQADRWYVLEQRGTIKMFRNDNAANPSVWLDFFTDVLGPGSSGEGRLLGIEFHPDFPTAPEVFVYFTGDRDGELASVLLRVVLDDVDAPVSPVIHEILILSQAGFGPMHKGGDIRFGTDGNLYIAFGDGGGEVNKANAHDTGNLYGGMLRLDVSGGGSGYSIPADNPFAGNPLCATGITGQSCPELYAWGLRNPFRWSIDPSGVIWLGDVGENRREEINRIGNGFDYGWPCEEGTLPHRPEVCAVGDVLQPPAFEYAHDDGDSSVTGGFLYSGTALPELQGRYVFADFVSGRIWALSDDGAGSFSRELLVDSDLFIPAIEAGQDNEIYVADYSNGRIWRLDSSDGAAVDTIPQKLSDTGCFSSTDPLQTAASAIPYDINAPFWSDGAVKSRFFAIPDGTTIDIDADDDWIFPDGSVLIKNFRLDGKLIESRMFMRHPDGTWGGYTWEWNDAETDATRVIGGKVRMINGQQWIYPSEGACGTCHTAVAGFSLGPETAQLNRSMTYPAPIDVTDNQLDTLNRYGYFTSPQAASDMQPALVDVSDPSADLGQRARAWLHSNCSTCHRPGGPTPVSMDLRYTTVLSATGTCDTPPSNSLGIANALLIAPGEPDRSVLLSRISRRDEYGMPPLGSNIVDDAGIAIVSDWISGLADCN